MNEWSRTKGDLLVTVKKPLIKNPSVILKGKYTSNFMMNITWCSVSHSSLCRCSLGYYGDPQLPGGSCHPCRCNPSGSVHVNCDRATGQCLCKQGVTGQLCEECEPRHLLVEDECVCRCFLNSLLSQWALVYSSDIYVRVIIPWMFLWCQALFFLWKERNLNNLIFL